jgi:NtrC-family two-component system response regulator AlgB
MGRGAVDFLCKPFTPDQLTAAIARAAELHELESTVGLWSDRRGTAGSDADFATTSARQQEAIVRARNLASSSESMLIVGESGTGKRVLARAIHGWSGKLEGPFSIIDCASHSSAYIDLAIFGDSLFGNQIITAERPPLVRRCAGGALLLTHVDALSPVSQERLSKLVKTGQYALLDGPLQRPRDLRIICTTTSLSALIEPLRAALADEQISLPPLRERANDIPFIAQRYFGFLRQTSGKSVLGFSNDALDALSGYPWPGNLRELRKVVADLVETCTEPYIERRQISAEIREFKPAPSRHPRAGENISLSDLEAAHIRAIVSASPSLRAAADVLGLNFQALYRRRKQFGLE